jgi:hypothetical protein
VDVHALEDGQQGDELGRLAGIRQRKDDVGARDHTDVAMAGLGSVQEEGGCSRACERRCNLVADVARLAHAGDDHAAAAGIYQPAGLDESLVDVSGERRDGCGFDGKDVSGAADRLRAVQLWFHGVGSYRVGPAIAAASNGSAARMGVEYADPLPQRLGESLSALPRFRHICLLNLPTEGSRRS